jgi:hypothetical protein
MKVRLMAVCALFFSACCAVPCARHPQTVSGFDQEKTYFAAETADVLQPGHSTRADVERVLGMPYIDKQDEEGRLQYVYMYTLKRQLLLSFDGEVLAAKKWSEAYGHPALPQGK